jgi:hypothetical protein
LCCTNSDVGFAVTDYSGASFTALANSVPVGVWDNLCGPNARLQSLT